MSLGDVLTRHRDKVDDDTIALYSSDGKLKPGALVSTITDPVEGLRLEYDLHIGQFEILKKKQQQDQQRR